MSSLFPRLDARLLRRLISAALIEDCAEEDLTSALTVTTGSRVRANIIANRACIVAGIPVAAEVFRACDRLLRSRSSVRFRGRVRDGARVRQGQVVAALDGGARAILAGERTALNFLQQLSGVATLTRLCVDRVRGTRAVIKHTRKTIPNCRHLQLYAAQIGGASLHRVDLGSGVLIKDNHLAAALARDGRAAAALVRSARAGLPRGIPLEVEVQDLRLLGPVLEAGADVVMLDNASPESLRRGVRVVRAFERRAGCPVIVEASGGITPDTVRSVARTGVDWISIGALTHSAPAMDFSLAVV